MVVGSGGVSSIGSGNVSIGCSSNSMSRSNPISNYKYRR